MKKKVTRILLCVAMVAVIVSTFSVTAFAAGDVAGAIEQTWNTAKTQVPHMDICSIIHMIYCATHSIINRMVWIVHVQEHHPSAGRIRFFVFLCLSMQAFPIVHLLYLHIE